MMEVVNMLVAVPSEDEFIRELCSGHTSFSYARKGNMKIDILDTKDGVVETWTVNELGRILIKGIRVENLWHDTTGITIKAINSGFVCDKLLFKYDKQYYRNYIQFENFGIKLGTFDTIYAFCVKGNKFYIWHKDNTFNDPRLVHSYISTDGDYKFTGVMELEIEDINYKTFLRRKLTEEGGDWRAC